MSRAKIKPQVVIVDDCDFVRLVWKKNSTVDVIADFDCLESFYANPEHKSYLLAPDTWWVIDYFFDNSHATGEKIVRELLPISVSKKFVLSSDLPKPSQPDLSDLEVKYKINISVLTKDIEKVIEHITCCDR